MTARHGVGVVALAAVAGCGRASPAGPARDPVEVMVVGDSTRLRLADPLPATSPFFDGAQVAVTAARGEIVALQVLYRGARAVRATVPAGAGVAVSAWGVEPVTVVHRSTAMWGPSRGPGAYPDRLRPLDAAATAGPVLLELTVARDAPVGVVIGELTIDAARYPLAITIAPVVLPALGEAPRVWAYYDAREVAAVAGPDRAAAAEAACAAMLRAHGVMATPELTLDSYAARKDAVAGSPYVPVLLPRDAVEATVAGWRDRLAGTGQVAFAIPIDEPRDDRARAEVRALADRVRAAGGGPGRFLYAVTDTPRPAYGDLVDLYISPFAITRDGPRQPERWTYNGTPPWAGAMTVDAAGPDLRTWGWIAWRWRVPVWYVWDALYWHDRHNRKRHGQDPMAGPANDGGTDAVTFDDDEDHGNLDGALVLPPAPGAEATGCTPTLRLATLRRGLEDRLLLDALVACGGAARAEAIAEAVVPVALGDARRGAASAWPADEAAFEAARRELHAALAACPAAP